MEDCDDQKSQSLDGMNEYLRRGLCSVVRRQLEEEVEQAMNESEKKLIAKVVDILPHITQRLIQIYRDGDKTLTPTSSSDAAAANDSQLSIENMFRGVNPSFEHPNMLGDLGPCFEFLDNTFDTYDEPLGLSSTFPPHTF